MPPRMRLGSTQLSSPVPRLQYVCLQCRHASLAATITPAPPIDPTVHAAPLIARYPSTQPPSHKRPEFRKSQLHRQYQSMLRSSPLMLIFQHNNLKSSEWVGIRRELITALRKVDEELANNGNQGEIGGNAKLQVVQTGIFASALKVVEFWSPNFDAEPTMQNTTDAHTASSVAVTVGSSPASDSTIMHGLSTEAWKVAKKNTQLKHGLEPLLSGPLAILSFPSVSPQHLKTALSILSPSPEFPAPKRKANPGYHEPAVQSGLQKLMLMGARVEGKAFDVEGAKWVGSIQGGLEGLRGQLVAMLQGIGAGITNTLESASKSLYVTVEGRRGMLEEEAKGNA